MKENLKFNLKKISSVKTEERDSKTLEFVGVWDDTSDPPTTKFVISNLSDSKTEAVLTALNLTKPGEELHLSQVKDPYLRLDEFLNEESKAKKPSLEKFKTNAEKLPLYTKREKLQALQAELVELVQAGKETTGEFDFKYDCYLFLGAETGSGYYPEKEEFIKMVKNPPDPFAGFEEDEDDLPEEEDEEEIEE